MGLEGNLLALSFLLIVEFRRKWGRVEEEIYEREINLQNRIKEKHH